MSDLTKANIRKGVLDVALMLLVVVVALAIALVFIAIYGVSPGRAISAFAQGAFSGNFNLGSTISKMVPLTMVALGWIVAFRGGRIQVGFPGQIITGGIFASIVALKISLPIWLHLPLTVAAGMLGGGLCAWVAAWLWAKRGVNEILSTLLINLVMAQILDWWVQSPFHDPSTPLPQTRALPTSALYPVLLTNTDLHWDIILLPVLVGAVAFVLARTVWGFKVRVCGANPLVAKHSGISPTRIGTQAMFISGALAGLAGASLVLAGTTPAMGEVFEGGVGFNGIAVALLARNSPWGVLPAALLFAALAQGGQVMQATVNISSELVGIIQGLMIMLVLAATTMLYITQSRRRKGPGEREVVPPPELRGAELGATP
jgi:simple sugar transport system permease protein